ncbi:MAG: tRNA threonylcarbamoyladenosine dehydratase [Eubacteriales bacterium]|nr:tRNA threonylcarbamoyladenosine dehydratase [Eubacteriales bacterium]
MATRYARTALLLGADGVERLKAARVAVFGLGGVGGYAAEALLRSGIGTLDVFDGDVYSESNLNRQLHATVETIGMNKALAVQARARLIAPDAAVTAYPLFYAADNADTIDLSRYDGIIDAIDTVSSKIELICRAKAAGVYIVSSMGAGNKLSAAAFQIADIADTSVCPLARVMRRELKKRGIEHLPVVYSTEPPITPLAPEADDEAPAGKRQTPGSLSYVPAVAGLLLAGEVIQRISGVKGQA